MTTPPRTPAECLATLLLWLSLTVDGRSFQGRLARPLVSLILNRIRPINRRFARLAALITAGRYVPRRSAPPRPHVARGPRRPNPLPHHFGWLKTLVPETIGFVAQLEHLFADAEMAALMAAAPAPMRRPLRSLCWMLGVDPPTVLARPPPADRPPAPPPEPPPAPRSAGRPPPPAAPDVPQPRAKRPPTPKTCGPPLPA